MGAWASPLSKYVLPGNGMAQEKSLCLYDDLWTVTILFFRVTTNYGIRFHSDKPSLGRRDNLCVRRYE